MRCRIRRQAALCACLGLVSFGCSLAPEAVPNAGIVYRDVPYEGKAFPQRRTSLPTPADGLAIVADTLSDTLSLVDLTARARVGADPVGRDPLGIDGPAGAVLDRGHGALLVMLSYPVKFVGAHAGHAAHGAPPGYVQKLAADDLRILGETAVDTEPTSIALSDDGKRLVVTQLFQAGLDAAAKDITQLELARARLSVFDPGRVGDPTAPDPTAIRVCLGATGVALSRPDGARAYVACSGEDAVAVVDVGDPNAPVTRVPLGPDAGEPAKPELGAYASVLSPDGATLAITTTLSKDVRLFHVSGQSIVASATVPVGGTPRVPAFTGDGAILYVPVRDPDLLIAIDVAGGSVSSSHALLPRECVAPAEVAVRGRAPLLVVCAGDAEGSGQVAFVDPGTLDVAASVDVGRSSSTLVLFPGSPP